MALLFTLPTPGHAREWKKAREYKNITADSTPETPIPLVVTNNCPETIWPGIGTQNGIGPGTGGFALDTMTRREMWVSPNWQGRIWGRTNCSFNEEGTGPSNLNGVNGNGAACSTGDCFGRLNCQFTVSSIPIPIPTTTR